MLTKAYKGLCIWCICSKHKNSPLHFFVSDNICSRLSGLAHVAPSVNQTQQLAVAVTYVIIVIKLIFFESQ